MIKIKYNDTESFEEVIFSKTGNIVSLKGTKENNSGFKTYRMNGELLGDFSDYNTTYRIIDNEVQYSNDGSVWIEPTPYEPTEPTWQETIEAQVLYTSMMTDTMIKGE